MYHFKQGDKMNKLREDQLKEDIEQGFIINDIHKATWALKKIKAIEEKKQQLKQIKDYEIESIENWYIKETAELEKDRTSLETLLQLYYLFFYIYAMINLYPLISTNPDELKDFDEKIHKTNLEKIKAILTEFKNSDILLCYGDVLNKRKYLKEPCLKDILNVCTILNKNNDRWDYLKYVINQH